MSHKNAFSMIRTRRRNFGRGQFHADWAELEWEHRVNGPLMFLGKYPLALRPKKFNRGSMSMTGIIPGTGWFLVNGLVYRQFLLDGGTHSDKIFLAAKSYLDKDPAKVLLCLPLVTVECQELQKKIRGWARGEDIDTKWGPDAWIPRDGWVIRNMCRRSLVFDQMTRDLSMVIGSDGTVDDSPLSPEEMEMWVMEASEGDMVEEYRGPSRVLTDLW